MSTVEIRNLQKRYGKEEILRGVDLTVSPGDFMVVYGMPSSGKSVLVRLLTGLEKPDQGQILFRGQDATHLSPGERNIGYVPQSFALYPHFSVRDNIAYPLDLAKVPKKESAPEVERASTLLGIQDLLDRRPDQLSGGQKQRVAIARGLVKRTNIFILDDPLVGLDFKLRERLIDDLKETQELLGVTFIYTTSDAVESLMLGSTIAMMSEGRIVEVGSPEQIYAQPTRAESMRYLGFPQSNFIEGTLHPAPGQGDGMAVRTALFDLPMTLRQGRTMPPAGASVLVGVRPENLRLGPAKPDMVRLPAQVLLSEDLGGEEIVYLLAQGMQLATVVRSNETTQADTTIDAQVTISIDPHDLKIFADNERIGQGAGIGEQ
jgi:ABC-type sugar transport system ATPase subunit